MQRLFLTETQMLETVHIATAPTLARALSELLLATEQEATA